MHKIDIMISTKDRPTELALLLQSLRSQTFQNFDIFIMVMIVLSVLDIILESEKHLSDKYGYIFSGFEAFSVVVFTIEYIIRVWTCVENKIYKSALTGRLKFMFTPMALIDLLSILPFYLPFIGVDLRFLRTLRLLRIFRILMPRLK